MRTIEHVVETNDLSDKLRQNDIDRLNEFML